MSSSVTSRIGYVPTWARRVPGWSLLAFFLSLALLTALAASFNVVEQMEITGYLAALASTTPLVFLAAAYHLRPLWVIQVPADEEVVARAVHSALGTREATPSDVRKGAFVRCSSVLLVGRPPCALGWYHLGPRPGSAPSPPHSVVVLEGHSADRRELGALRTSLRDALLARVAAA